MYAFDTSTGNELWHFAPTFNGNGFTFLEYVEAGAAIVNGVVYWPAGGSMWAFSLPGLTQLTALRTAVTAVGSGTSLADKITTIEGYVAANDNADACSTLGAFIHQVNTQTPSKITTAQAASFISQAQAIETTLGC
jgi:hypothetical protein